MDFLHQLSFWHWQVILFAIMSLAFSIIYYRRFRTLNNTNDHPTLNNRTARMHGTQFVLVADLLDGKGAQQIGDTRWELKAESALSANTKVIVTDNDNMTLLIKPVTG